MDELEIINEQLSSLVLPVTYLALTYAIFKYTTQDTSTIENSTTLFCKDGAVSKNQKKSKLQSKLNTLLKKHCVEKLEDKARVFELLDIALDHYCHCLVRNVQNGKELHKITDKSKIKHKIQFKTTKKVYYFDDASYGFATKNATTQISLCGHVTERKFRNDACRHMVQIPLIPIVFDLYNIDLPYHIAAVTGEFLHGKLGEEFEEYGICYPCLTGKHRMVTGSDHEYKDHDDSFPIHQSYINNEKGDIILTLKSTNDEYETDAFRHRYQNIIDSHNKQINQYLAKNKFYNITPMRSNAIVVENPSTTHFLVRGFTYGDIYRCKNTQYKLRTVFGGFNNLNMNERVTVKNTIIESKQFGIDWRADVFETSSKLRTKATVVKIEDGYLSAKIIHRIFALMLFKSI